MSVPARIIVGLMSGTSLDGISAAVVRFHDDASSRPHAELLGFSQRGYTSAQRVRLEQAMQSGTAQEYCRLHADVGDWLAQAALDTMADAGVTRTDVAAITSHGQTLWHEPGHSTWQIGDASRIAERTGCAVVADLRARDVAAGGQGAPLVPIADALLFSHETAWRAMQNLGGIGNVTVVPPSDTHAHHGLQAIRAFDTGPGVVIIDAVVRTLYPELPFDRDGAIAAAGVAREAVIQWALSDPYFSAEPPKSTGRELFSRAFVQEFVQRCRDHHASDADVVTTATAFTAASLADQYARFVAEPVQDVLLSGGGAKNPTLVRCIRDALQQAGATDGAHVPAVRLFDELFFDGEAKEAVAFALMGYLHITGRAGNLPAATGARVARPLGSLTPA